MRESNPLLEKNFSARLLNKPLSGRFRQFLGNPVFALRLLRDRWYECRHVDYPLLVPKANAFLQRNISSDAVGLEWGSGGSTIWFAQHGRSLISIEHSDVWYSHVQQRLAAQNLTNVDYRCIPLEHAEAEPTHLEYPTTPKYVTEIETWPDESFDFVLIDGHYRQACLRACLPKLKPGGLLIVDDSHFMPLSEWGVPDGWPVALKSHTGIKETTICRKPE